MSWFAKKNDQAPENNDTTQIGVHELLSVLNQSPDALPPEQRQLIRELKETRLPIPDKFLPLFKKLESPTSATPAAPSTQNPVAAVEETVQEAVTTELPEPSSPASIYQKVTDKKAKAISLNSEEVDLALAKLMELAGVPEGAQYQGYRDAEKIAGKIRIESAFVDSLVYLLNLAKNAKGRAVFIVEENENDVSYHFPKILSAIFKESASQTSEVIPRDATISANRLFNKILTKLPDQKITDIPREFAEILKRQFSGRYLIAGDGVVDLKFLKYHTFDLKNKANTLANLLSHDEINWLFDQIGREVLDGPVNKNSTQNIWNYILKNNKECLRNVDLGEIDLALYPIFTHDTYLIMDELKAFNSPELIEALVPKIVEYFQKKKAPKSEEEVRKMILGLWLSLFRTKGDKYATSATSAQAGGINKLISEIDRAISKL